MLDFEARLGNAWENLNSVHDCGISALASGAADLSLPPGGGRPKEAACRSRRFRNPEENEAGANRGDCPSGAGGSPISPFLYGPSRTYPACLGDKTFHCPRHGEPRRRYPGGTAGDPGIPGDYRGDRRRPRYGRRRTRWNWEPFPEARRSSWDSGAAGSGPCHTRLPRIKPPYGIPGALRKRSRKNARGRPRQTEGRRGDPRFRHGKFRPQPGEGGSPRSRHRKKFLSPSASSKTLTIKSPMSRSFPAKKSPSGNRSCSRKRKG